MTPRRVTVKGPFRSREYEAFMVHQPIEVEGTTGKDIEVVLEVMETQPGDVQCAIHDHAIQCESASGSPFTIERLTVRLPEHVSLSLQTVSGDISVRKFSGTPALRLRTVSGDMHVGNCSDVTEVSAHTVSGDLEIADSRIARVRAKTVSGDVRLVKSRIGRLAFDSISGDVIKREATVDEEDVDRLKGLGARIKAHVFKEVGRS